MRGRARARGRARVRGRPRARGRARARGRVRARGRASARGRLSADDCQRSTLDAYLPTYPRPPLTSTNPPLTRIRTLARTQQAALRARQYDECHLALPSPLTPTLTLSRQLSALDSMTSATKSLVISLALARGHIGALERARVRVRVA